MTCEVCRRDLDPGGFYLRCNGALSSACRELSLIGAAQRVWDARRARKHGLNEASCRCVCCGCTDSREFALRPDYRLDRVCLACLGNGRLDAHLREHVEWLRALDLALPRAA